MNTGQSALLGLVVGIGACVWATGLAKRKGRSRLWGVASFFVAPIALVLLALPSRIDEEVHVPPFDGSTTQMVTIEKRRRGVFGKIVAALFWFWQVIMGVWFISYMSDIASTYNKSGSNAERAGTALGGTLGVSIILWTWLFGAIILGLMMLFTRGEKIIVTRQRT